MVKNSALVIVDAERCFFPAEEGIRLDMEGFGELAVPHGERIIEPLNFLTIAAVGGGLVVAHTLDKHPAETAHFSDDPNYINTWSPHGRDGTPGSLLHPDLIIDVHPQLSKEFIKGDRAATSPEEDDSYTGALAHNRSTSEILPSFLKRKNASYVYVAGLAIGDGAEHKLCVDSTAVDLKNLGFRVSVITDAVEAVIPENREICFRNLGATGIRLMTVCEALEEIKATRYE